MDREDGGLGVVRAGEHHLQLELVELAPECQHAVADLGVERSVAGLGGELEQDLEILGLGGELLDAGDGTREIGPLADQLLGAPVVVPERRRAHLGVERGQAGLLARDVKDAPEARRRVRPGR
jgi:hypothetical protein